MLQIFRDNQFITIILVFVYFLVLGTNSWLYPNLSLEYFQELPNTFSQWLFGWIDSPSINRTCFVLLVLIQAFAANGIVNHFKLSKEYSFITAICFILIHFSYYNIDSCSPPLIANSFLLWALYSLLASYDKKSSFGSVFNIGFAVAMAALIYHGNIVYFLWAIIGLFIIRSFDFQEFVLLLAGFFIPFFLVGTYHYLDNNLIDWWENEILAHYQQLNILYDFNYSFYILLAILITPFLLALANLQALYGKTTSKERKYINVILLMPLIGLLSFLVQNKLYSFHFVIFFVPIAFLLSMVLQSYKSKIIAELIHLILFMICLGIQYQSFFFQN